LLGLTVTNTITGSISGNAATATTLQTARTINGTSFNGSANITTANWGTARTITVGATGKSVNGSGNVSWSLAEIGAPSSTGTGASGTWGISITGSSASTTGNAATVTNGVYTTGNQTIGGTKTLSSGAIISGSISSGATDYGYYQAAGTNLILKGDSLGRSGIFFESEKDGTIINHPSDYGFIQFHSYGFNGTSGESNKLVIGVANDSDDEVILQSPYNGGVKVGYRNATSGTGLTLQTVLHAGNYNSYSPTLTGGGASGTWGINITGNAATASSVAWGNVSSKPSNIMYYQGFTLNADTMDSNSTGFTYSVGAPAVGPVARFSAGGSYDLWLNAAYGGGNNLFFRTRNGDNGTLNPWRALVSYGVNFGDSLYGTILYDSDNSAFYCDPASTSNLNAITVNSNITFTNSGTAKRGVTGTMGDNDQWFIGGGATASNAGYLEISTGDDGQTIGSAEYIYVRQYGPGTPLTGTLTRTGALLDNNGNTWFPGNVTAYYSDERLKTKTGTIANAVDKVKILEGFYYVENELAKANGYNNSEQQVGLSAQQVQSILPEAVSLAPFDRIADEVTNDSVSKSGENYLTVDYARLVPLLVEAIKEQQTQIEELTSQINTLKEMIK
jgi:hypothetical protein